MPENVEVVTPSGHGKSEVYSTQHSSGPKTALGVSVGIATPAFIWKKYDFGTASFS